MIKVNGTEYPFPPEALTLGEMCDAEDLFHVDFNEATRSGIRMAAAMLWIAIHRVDPTVTVEDIRSLEPEVFEQLVGEPDADPPPEPSSSESSGPTSSSSTPSSDDSEIVPSRSGSLVSDTTSDSDLATLPT